MNEVERIYRLRDQRIERGEIHIILPEEEHRKHQKDGTFPGPAAPTNEFEVPFDTTNMSNIGGGGAGGGHEPRPTNQIVPQDAIPYPNPGALALPDGTETDRYCICAKQNDN